MEKKDIIALLGEERTCTDPDVLAGYAQGIGLDRGRVPAAVLYPETAAEVEQAIGCARAQGCPVVTVSSQGPRYMGNTLPCAEGTLMLDLSRMRRVISANRQQRMAVLEPGVSYEQALAELAEKGLTLSMPLAPKAGKSVVASLIEVEPRLNCIHQWNYVEPLRCLEVVWGDGNRMRTGDASGGPADLAKQQEKQKWQLDAPGPMMVDYYRLVTGSMGTMGVAAWASVRCEILPKRHEMFFVADDDLSRVVDFCYRVIRPRFSDELFLVSAQTFRALAATRGVLPAGQLPQWIALVGIAGRDCAADLRVDGQTEDIGGIASDLGLHMERALCGCSGEQLLEIATHPCPEGKYWKTISFDGCEDLFFITTMNRAKDFWEMVSAEAARAGYPADRVRAYVQPAHQGVCCHCEFILPYRLDEARRTKELALALAARLSEAGAYFSRPYPNWAGMQIAKDPVTKKLIEQVKGVFDPMHIMNPGKLGEEW